MSDPKTTTIRNVEEALTHFDTMMLEQRLELGRGLILDNIPADQITVALAHQRAVAVQAREQYRASTVEAFAHLHEQGPAQKGSAMTVDDALTTAGTQFDQAALPVLRKLEQLLLEAGVDDEEAAREVLGWRVHVAQARQELLDRVKTLASE